MKQFFESLNSGSVQGAGSVYCLLKCKLSSSDDLKVFRCTIEWSTATIELPKIKNTRPKWPLVYDKLEGSTFEGHRERAEEFMRGTPRINIRKFFISSYPVLKDLSCSFRRRKENRWFIWIALPSNPTHVMAIERFLPSTELENSSTFLGEMRYAVDCFPLYSDSFTTPAHFFKNA